MDKEDAAWEMLQEDHDKWLELKHINQKLQEGKNFVDLDTESVWKFLKGYVRKCDGDLNKEKCDLAAPFLLARRERKFLEKQVQDLATCLVRCMHWQTHVCTACAKDLEAQRGAVKEEILQQMQVWLEEITEDLEGVSEDIKEVYQEAEKPVLEVVEKLVGKLRLAFPDLCSWMQEPNPQASASPESDERLLQWQKKLEKPIRLKNRQKQLNEELRELAEKDVSLAAKVCELHKDLEWLVMPELCHFVASFCKPSCDSCAQTCRDLARFLPQNRKDAIEECLNFLDEHHPPLAKSWILRHQQQVPWLSRKPDPIADPKLRDHHVAALRLHFQGPSISLQDYNTVSFRKTRDQRHTEIEMWLKDSARGSGSFDSLHAVLFDLLKRRETWDDTVEAVNTSIKDVGLQGDLGTISTKQLFATLYQMADLNLRFKILSEFAWAHPVPLVYPRWFGESEPDMWNVNGEIVSVLDEGTCILSFGIGKCQRPCGKSMLLNAVFATQFEQISSVYSCGTVDLHMDKAFNPGRGICIADAHGACDPEHLAILLGWFDMLLVHVQATEMNSDTFEQLKKPLLEASKAGKRVTLLLRDADGDFMDDIATISSTYPALQDIVAESAFRCAAVPSLVREHDKESTMKYRVRPFVLNSLNDTLPRSAQPEVFIEKVLVPLQKHVDNLPAIMKIDQSAQDCLNEMDLHKEDFSSPQIFPSRQLLSDRRRCNKVLKDPRCSVKQIERAKAKLQKVKEELQSLPLTKTDELFLDMVKSPAVAYASLFQLSQRMQVKCKAWRDHASQGEMAKTTVSLELLWRELLTLAEHRPAALSDHADVWKCVANVTDFGEPFELIDGDNLQFAEKQLEKVFAVSKERVLVLSVIGPQSSGKSTLLNYLFGCRFNTSAGRCTRGIYAAVLSIRDPNYDKLMILDTEGLQSSEKNDPEFDRKITLTCLAVSHIVIINVNGDMNLHMKNLLEICCFSWRELKKAKVAAPDIFFCFNQCRINHRLNGDSDKDRKTDIEPFQKQLKNAFKEISEAGPDAADADLLNLPLHRIQVLTSAFNTQTIEKDERQGQHIDWHFSSTTRQFVLGAADFADEIFKCMQERATAGNSAVLSCQYGQIGTWADKACDIWRTIENFPDLIAFPDVKAMQDDKLMREFQRNFIQKNLTEQQDEHQAMVQRHLNDVDLSRVADTMYLQSCLDKATEEVKAHFDSIATRAAEELQEESNRSKIDLRFAAEYTRKLQEFVIASHTEFTHMITQGFQKLSVENSQKKGIKSLITRMQDLLRQGKEINEDDAEEEFEACWRSMIEKMTCALDSEHFYQQLWFPMRDVYGTLQKLPELPQSSLQTAARESVEGLMHTIVEELKNARQIFVHIMGTSASENLQKPQHFLPLSDFLEQHREYDVCHFDVVPAKVNWQQLRVLLIQAVGQGRSQVARLLQEIHAFGWRFDSTFADTLFDVARHCGWNWTLNSAGKQLAPLFKQYQCFVKRMTGLLPRNPLVRLSDGHFFVGCLVEMTQDLVQGNCYQSSSLEAGTHGTLLQETEKGMLVLVDDAEWIILPIYLRLVLPPAANRDTGSKYIQLSDVAKPQSHYKEGDVVLGERLRPPQAKAGFEGFEEGLKYLCNPVAEGISISFAQRQISELVLQNMPWQKLLDDIRGSIDLEVDTSKIEGEAFDHCALSSFSVDVVQLVRNATAEIVKKLDRNLEAFGLQLDMTGEGIIHFFSLVYAWTLVAAGSRARALRPMAALRADKEKWRAYFVSTLCAGPSQRSNVLGEQMAYSIWMQATDQNKIHSFHDKLKTRIQSAQQEFTAAKIQAALDAKLLRNLDPSVSEEVVKYVTDPVRCIKEEFQRLWQSHFEPARDEVLHEYKSHVQSLLQTYKEAVDRLVDFLQERGLTSSLSQSLFYSLETAEFLSQGSFRDKAAGHFFLDLISGSKGEQGRESQEQHSWSVTIEGQEFTCNDQLQDLFCQVSERLELKELSDVANDVPCEIPMLCHFCKALASGLQKHIGKIKAIKWTVTEGGVDKIYNSFKNASIGCTETCPTCGRKCDQDNRTQHDKHCCESGHQIRGMFGVKVGRNKASTLTCDEIPDSSHIEVRGERITWQCAKQQHFPKWHYHYYEDAKERIENLMKYRECWNNHGRSICEHFQREHNLSIEYTTDYEQLGKYERVHFIIAMDQSAAVGPEQFASANCSLLRFLAEADAAATEKGLFDYAVSIILFSSTASTVLEKRPLHDEAVAAAIKYSGGSSNWAAAWEEILQQISNSEDDFDRHIVSFYLDSHDGEAARNFGAKMKELGPNVTPAWWPPYPKGVPFNHETAVQCVPEVLSQMHLEQDQ